MESLEKHINERVVKLGSSSQEIEKSGRVVARIQVSLKIKIAKLRL